MELLRYTILKEYLDITPLKECIVAMDYPIDTPAQARAVLRALRQARGLSQAQAGLLLGLSQKRIARIESAPGRISMDQLAKLVALMGGRIVIKDNSSVPTGIPAAKTKAKGIW